MLRLVAALLCDPNLSVVDRLCTVGAHPSQSSRKLRGNLTASILDVPWSNSSSSSVDGIDLSPGSTEVQLTIESAPPFDDH